MLIDLWKNTNFRVVSFALIGLMLLFLFNRVNAGETPFETTMTFYSSDTKAFITDSSYEKIADVELKNAVTKSGGKLYLQDCGILTCSVYVDFTPTSEYIIDTKDFGGVVVGTDRVHYSMAYLYKTSVVERTRPTYTEESKTVEVCSTDNATLKTTCKNESQANMVQTGVETYEETINEYKPIKEGELLKAGQEYRFRFDYVRDRVNEVADLQPKLLSTIEGWAWWNTTFNYKRCLLANITANATELPYVDLDETHTNGSDIRVVWENSTTELGFWRRANFSSATASGIIIANTTAIQGTDRTNAEICIYYNATGVSDNSVLTSVMAGMDFLSSTDLASIYPAPNDMGKALVSPTDVNLSRTSLTGCGAYCFTGFAVNRTSGYAFSPFYPAIYEAKMTNNPALNNQIGIAFTDNFGATYSKDRLLYFNPAGAPNMIIVHRDSGTTVCNANITTNTDSIFRMTFSNSTNAIAEVFNNTGARVFSCSINFPTALSNEQFALSQEPFTAGTWAEYDYWFAMPYSTSIANFSAWETEEEVDLATAPTNNLIALNPTVLYKNMTVACAVNWTHPTNSTFTVYQGLTINGTVEDSFNQTNTAYTNGTIWNYTSYPLSVMLTHGDKLACWSRANSTDTNSTMNYTANYTIGNWPPTIESTTITSPLINGTDAIGTAVLSDVEGDAISCYFEWWNTTDNVTYNLAYNNTQSPCTNTSTITSGNYSTGQYLHFFLFVNDSLGNSSSTNSLATLVLPSFVINNYTYTSPQYETVAYSRSINISLPSGETLNYAVVEINSVNFTSTCTNVSTQYHCELNNTPAPPVSSNATVKTNTWYINYTSGATTVLATQAYNTTILFGMWPTGILSDEEVAMESNAQVNITYANASGFLALTASLSGGATVGTSSGSLICSAGLCTGYVAVPTVTKNTIYRVGANYTITSPFWGTSVTRNVSIESNAGREASTLQTYTGTCTSPSNFNDSSWTTYATAGTSCVLYENYTMTQMANTTTWRTKDTAGTRDITIPEDCWGSTLQFKVLRNISLAQYYCWNYTTDSFVMLNSYSFVTNYYLYEENLTTANWYNNSFLRVVPYGLSTSCASGSILFTYTCKDEDTKSIISCDYEQLFTLTLDTGVEVDYAFNGTDTTWDICIVPSSLNGTVDSIEQYSGTGYETRDYFLTDTETSGKPYSQTIYLGTDADTQLTYIYVKRAGVKVSGAYVYVQKHFVSNDTFENVAMVKTDTSDGKGNTYLIPNTVWYRFIVVESGVVSYTSETQHVACSPSASFCTVTLNMEASSIDFWNYYNGITSNCTFTNATKVIGCTFVVNDGTSKNFDFYVYNFTNGQTLLYNNSADTSSGTLYFDLGDNSTTGRYSYYLRVDDDYILESGWVNLNDMANWGEDSPIIALFIILTLAFAFSLAGPSMMVIGAYLGLVVSWLFDFINLGEQSLTIIGGMGVVVAVLVYAFRK